MESEDQLEAYYEILDSDLAKLEIKQSKLPNCGLGLFATETIEPGEYIAEYYGPVLPSKYSMHEQFNDEDKMVEIDKEYCVISRSAASRANDIVKWQPNSFTQEQISQSEKLKQIPVHEGVKHNAKISLQRKKKVFLMAYESIKPGDEIYIDNGYQYWDFFLKQVKERANNCRDYGSVYAK